MNKYLIEGADFFCTPDVIEAELLQDSPATCAACSRWGDMIAVGCVNGSVSIFDSMTRGLAATMSDPTGISPVTSVTWTRNGIRVLVGHANGLLLVWDVSKQVVVAQHQFPQEIVTLSVTQSSKLEDEVALVTFPLGEPKMWRQASNTETVVPFGAEHSKLFAAIDPRGNFFLVGSDKSLLAMYDPKTLHVMDIIQVTSGRGQQAVPSGMKGISMKPTSSGALLLAQGCIREVHIKKVTAEHQAGAVPAAEAFAAAASVAPGESWRTDEKVLLTMGTDFRETVDNVRWRCCHTSSTGEFVLAGADVKDRHIMYIWDASSHQMCRVLEGPQVGLLCCIWQPSSYRQLMVSITVTGRIFIWAHIIKENWEIFAPGFVSLDQNKEHVESETEFDLNPDPSKDEEEEDLHVEEIDTLTIEPSDQRCYDSDTSTDIRISLRTVPLNLKCVEIPPSVHPPLPQSMPPQAIYPTSLDVGDSKRRRT